MEYRFTIRLDPRTKKNHQQIRRNVATGGMFVSPSRQYKEYLAEAQWLLNSEKARLGLREPLRGPLNIKAVYFMGTRRKVDISNLHECLHDVLVTCGIIEDDSCRVIIATDGSRIRYDKQNPRTEVTITEVTNAEEIKEWKHMFAKKR